MPPFILVNLRKFSFIWCQENEKMGDVKYENVDSVNHDILLYLIIEFNIKVPLSETKYFTNPLSFGDKPSFKSSECLDLKTVFFYLS